MKITCLTLTPYRKTDFELNFTFSHKFLDKVSIDVPLTNNTNRFIVVQRIFILDSIVVLCVPITARYHRISNLKVKM